VVVQVQQVLMTTVMHGLLGPAIVYGGAVLILRLASSGGLDAPAKSVVGLSAAYAAAFLGNLVSEYGLAAALSCVVLLATFKSVHRRFAALRVWHIVGFTMAAGCGYLVYRQLGVVPTHKTEIALLGGNTSVVWHLLSAAGHFPTAIWEASVGRLLQEIGSLSLGSTLFVKSFALGVIAAVTMSVVLRRRTATAASDRSRSRVYVGIGMFVALGVALGPVVLLGRTFVDNFQTRTLLPVLPVASCLGVSVLLFVLRERLTVIVAPLCFFLAAYSNSVQGFHALDEERHVERWGQQLEPLVAEDGLTVAVFEIPRRRQVPLGNGWIGSFSNNEFTARMAKGWPGATRKRFWAFRDWNTAVADGYLQGVDHAGTASNPRINRESRGSVRSGPVRRLLWITVDPGNLKLTITKTDFPVASSHSLR
jgi:hypothetical protein